MIEGWIAILRDSLQSNGRTLPIVDKPYSENFVEIKSKNLFTSTYPSYPFVVDTPKYYTEVFDEYTNIICEEPKRSTKQIKEKKIRVVPKRKYKINPKNEIALIYKITNKITGKIYIGQTIQHFGKRWCEHFYKSSKSTAKFHKEIRSYKKTDWTFEVIEEIVYPLDIINDPIERQYYLLERERYYIKLHDSINNGYNTK